MKNNIKLELKDALSLIEACKKEADKNSWNVSIAVCDQGGHVIALHRMDGSPLFSAQVSMEKAHCCAMSGKPSQVFEEMINNGRIAAVKLPFTPLKGGLPLIVENECIGAIGISGVKPDEDAQIAQAGVTYFNSLI